MSVKQRSACCATMRASLSAVSRQGEVNDASFVWSRGRRARAGRVAGRRRTGTPGCAAAGWRRSAAAATDRTFRCSRRTWRARSSCRSCRAFNAALGVTCSHCHVFVGPNDPMNDFAGDTKPTKNVARAMMRMVREINPSVQKAVPAKATDQVAARRLRDVPSRRGDSGGRARLAGSAAAAARRRSGRGAAGAERRRRVASPMPTPTREVSKPNAQLNVARSWRVGALGTWTLALGRLHPDHVDEFLHRRRPTSSAPHPLPASA